jgi:hypothetical protein
MIYTVGHAKTYDKYIAEDPIAAKRPGGTVWRTRKAAEKFLVKGYKVYGILAGWDAAQPDPHDKRFYEIIVEGKLVQI